MVYRYYRKIRTLDKIEIYAVISKLFNKAKSQYRNYTIFNTLNN